MSTPGFIASIDDINRGVFDCISTQEQVCPMPPKAVLHYMVNGQLNSGIQYFDFATAITQAEDIKFNLDEFRLIEFANKMFEDAVPMKEEESEAFYEAMVYLTKRKPTLPGRK